MKMGLGENLGFKSLLSIIGKGGTPKFHRGFGKPDRFQEEEEETRRDGERIRTCGQRIRHSGGGYIGGAQYFGP